MNMQNAAGCEKFARLTVDDSDRKLFVIICYQDDIEGKIFAS